MPDLADAKKQLVEKQLAEHQEKQRNSHDNELLDLYSSNAASKSDQAKPVGLAQVRLESQGALELSICASA